MTQKGNEKTTRVWVLVLASMASLDTGEYTRWYVGAFLKPVNPRSLLL